MAQQFSTSPIYAKTGCTLPKCLDTGYNCAGACRDSHHQDASPAVAVIETTKKSWYDGGWE